MLYKFSISIYNYMQEEKKCQNISEGKRNNKEQVKYFGEIGSKDTLLECLGMSKCLDKYT